MIRLTNGYGKLMVKFICKNLQAIPTGFFFHIVFGPSYHPSTGMAKFTGTSSTGLSLVTRTRALVHRWLLRQTGPWFKIRWHLASTHRCPTLAIPRVTLQHLAKVLSRKRAAKMAWRWVEASLKHELIVRSDWWTKSETYTVRITHTCPWSPQSALNTVVLFRRMIVKTCVDTLHLVQMLPSLSRTKFRLLLTEMDRSKCRG